MGTDFEKDALLTRFAENEKNGITKEMVMAKSSEVSKTADPVIPASAPSGQPEYDLNYDYDNDPISRQ